MVEIPITTSSPQQCFDVSIYRLHHAQRHLGSAVVQDPLQVIEQHPCQLLHRLESLPPQLVDPIVQVAQHGTLIGVVPQSVQALLQQIGLHDSSVQREELIELPFLICVQVLSLPITHPG